MDFKGKIAFLSAVALLFSGVVSVTADNSEVFTQGNIISASAEEVSENEWKELYKNKLMEIVSSGEYTSYNLAYTDNSDIPLLEMHAIGVKPINAVFGIDNGAVKEIAGGNCVYISNDGTITSEVGGAMYEEVIVYNTDGSVINMNMEQGVYTVDGKTVSYEEYDEIYKKYAVDSAKTSETFDISIDGIEQSGLFAIEETTTEETTTADTEPAETTAEETTTADTQPTDTQPAETQPTETETTTISETEVWKKLYTDKINEYKNDDFYMFDLFYLDNDDIPELFISDGQYHAAGVTVYTVSNGKLVELGTYSEYGEIVVTADNTLCSYWMGQGYEYIDFYTKDGSEMKKLDSFYNNAAAVPDEKDIEYKVNDINVTKSEFDKKLKPYDDREWFAVGRKYEINSLKEDTDLLALAGENPHYTPDIEEDDFIDNNQNNNIGSNGNSNSNNTSSNTNSNSKTSTNSNNKDTLVKTKTSETADAPDTGDKGITAGIFGAVAAAAAAFAVRKKK